MHVAMIGTGYVGLVSGVCFSEFGLDVVCVDKNADKIDRLNRGELPLYEPGLDSLMAGNVKGGRLSFTTDLGKAVDGAEAVFMPVGRPSRRGGGPAGAAFVHQAAGARPAAPVGRDPSGLVAPGWCEAVHPTHATIRYIGRPGRGHIREQGFGVRRNGPKSAGVWSGTEAKQREL